MEKTTLAIGLFIVLGVILVAQFWIVGAGKITGPISPNNISGTVAAPAPETIDTRQLTETEQKLLDEVLSINCTELEQFDDLEPYNNALMNMYRAIGKAGQSSCVRLKIATEEGDPIFTYYIVNDGKLRVVIDSYDTFGKQGVFEQVPASARLGYYDFKVKCPCGSGKALANCCNSKYPTPFVEFNGNPPVYARLLLDVPDEVK